MELKDKKYHVGGVSFEAIAEKYGTPVYVYDAGRIQKQYNTLKNAFSGVKVKIMYACKALTNPAIISLLREEGAGLDVVSVNEARVGISAGHKPGNILFTSNGINFTEIQEAVELGLNINIDNIPLLEQFGAHYHDSVPCSIRLNPHIMAGGNYKISTGHVNSKFGISIYQLPHLMKVIKTNRIKVEGLHVHTGSEILDADVWLKMADILFGVARDFPDLKFIDFGSGFKVAYRDDDITTNIYELGLKMSESFKSFQAEYGRDLEMWFEPGKYLVSEAGYFLVRTNVVKMTPATTFAGVDSGLNHLIRPMMYDAFHDIVNISNPEGVKRVYTITGYICETDNFGTDRKLNEIRAGDLLVMKNAGAYCYSMSSNYNMRERPAEVLVKDGNAQLIRRRETMEDMMRAVVKPEFSQPEKLEEQGEDSA